MWIVWDKGLSNEAPVDQSPRTRAVVSHIGLIAVANRLDAAEEPTPVQEHASEDGVPRYALTGTVLDSQPPGLLLVALDGFRVLADVARCANVDVDLDFGPSIIAADGATLNC
jgi:hypothetical protein